ncbi:hypothetical protein PHSC3_001585 [Chlamydiales bacterium STE3]|nr:hypothetical protein PHSC3_001585 [Chlamydiales bacterium STE3]
MTHSNDFPDLNQEKEKLQKMETEWLESLEDLESFKNENVNNELFSTLEYLKLCDLFFKNSCVELKKINKQLQNFYEFKNQQTGNSLKSFDELIDGLKHLKINLQNQLESLDNEYSILSEETLRRVQDLITKFTATKSSSQTIEDELNQNIDPRLFLQELKDSLGDYRQAREEFVSESIIEELSKLPDNLIPEDLGEEAPQIDPILSQLDTAITACASALIIGESTETE